MLDKTSMSSAVAITHVPAQACSVLLRESAILSYSELWAGVSTQRSRLGQASQLDHQASLERLREPHS